MRKGPVVLLLMLALVTLTPAVPASLAAKGYARFVGVKQSTWQLESTRVTVSWEAVEIASGVHRVKVTVEKVDGSTLIQVGGKWVEYPAHEWPKTVTDGGTEVEVPELQSGWYLFTVVVYGAGQKPKATAVSPPLPLGLS